MPERSLIKIHIGRCSRSLHVNASLRAERLAGPTVRDSADGAWIPQPIDADRLPCSLGPLPDDLSRGLVVPEPEKARLPQPSVTRPFGKSDLGDELGRVQCAPAGGSTTRRQTSACPSPACAAGCRGHGVSPWSSRCRPCRRNGGCPARSNRRARHQSPSGSPPGSV